MKILATNSPENKSGGLLVVLMLICMIIAIAFFSLTFSKISFQSHIWWMLLSILIIAFCLEYYLADEFLWQLHGKEIIYFDENGLVIQHYKRMINKKISIKWSDITNIGAYHSKWDFLGYFTLAGETQYTIGIASKAKKMTLCGVNINEYQRDKLVKQMQELHDMALKGELAAYLQPAGNQ